MVNHSAVKNLETEKKKKTEKHIQYPRSTVNVLILKILLSEQVNSVQGISTPDVQYFMRVVLT